MHLGPEKQKIKECLKRLIIWKREDLSLECICSKPQSKRLDGTEREYYPDMVQIGVRRKPERRYGKK